MFDENSGIFCLIPPENICYGYSVEAPCLWINGQKYPRTIISYSSLTLSVPNFRRHLSSAF